MGETLHQRMRRWRWNFLPSYRMTGGWITYLADDWREVRLKLPYNIWTRSYVNTIYCGAMFSAITPFYAAMILFNLTPQHQVWDKCATIQYLKPGRTTLYSHIVLTQHELDTITALLEEHRSIERTYRLPLVDADDTLHATLDQTVYIRRPRK